jgi:hypothetical protein
LPFVLTKSATKERAGCHVSCDHSEGIEQAVNFSHFKLFRFKSEASLFLLSSVTLGTPGGHLRN